MKTTSAALNVISQYQSDCGKLPVELAMDRETYRELDREAWAIMGGDAGTQGPLDHVSQMCGVWLHIHDDAASETLWANAGCYARRPLKPDAPRFGSEAEERR